MRFALALLLAAATPAAAKPVSLVVQGAITSTTGMLSSFGLKVGSRVTARAVYDDAAFQPITDVTANGLPGITAVSLGEKPSGKGLVIRAGNLLFNAGLELGGNLDCCGGVNYPRLLFQNGTFLGFSTNEQDIAGNHFLSYIGSADGVRGFSTIDGYDSATQALFHGAFDPATVRVSLVPEPGALALVALGVFGLVRRRRG